MHVLSQEELEQVYNKEDPWSYQANPADICRKEIIINTLQNIGPFHRALDLGCGEGWITTDIPADFKWGYEKAEKAKDRWPKNILNTDLEIFPPGYFDLVVATGVLYYNYDWQEIIGAINNLGSKYILTCNIADREIKEVDQIEGELIKLVEFPYHRSEQEMFTQRLRIYKR